MLGGRNLNGNKRFIVASRQSAECRRQMTKGVMRVCAWGCSPELGSQGSMSSSSLGHSADATSRSSADYGERIHKDINSHVHRHTLSTTSERKKTHASHPSCLFFTCEHTAPIHHPPILQVATNTFSVTAPKQWQAAKTRAPRREEERRKMQRNGDSCLKPQQPLLCSVLLTIPPLLCFPPAFRLPHLLCSTLSI